MSGTNLEPITVNSRHILDLPHDDIIKLPRSSHRASQSKNKLIVLQHNVNVWNDKRHALTNIYNNCDPDIILLNDHSMTDAKLVKIFNFDIHQSNKTNRHHRGTAI